jgi:streptogramin lyase
MNRIVLGVACLLAPAAAALAAAQPGAPPRVISIPATPRLPLATAPAPQPVGFAYSSVAGIALNSKGRLFVYQRGPVALMEFDEGGRFVRGFGEGMQTRAHSLRIDAADNLWVVDTGAHTVSKLGPNGEPLLTLGVKGQAGSWNEAAGSRLFNQPTDIAFAPNGDLFVSTGHGGPDPRIVRFDRDGKFITTWSLAHPDGSAATIHTVVVDSQGAVYAGDREAMKIRVFDASGRHLRDLQMNNLICGLSVDPAGNLWMTSGYDGMVMRLDWSGRVLGWTGKPGKGSNEYGEAHYLTVSRDLKTIFVSDTVNARVEKLVSFGG